MNKFLSDNLDSILQDLRNNDFTLELKVNGIMLNNSKLNILINPLEPLKAYLLRTEEASAMASDVEAYLLRSINKALKNAMYQNAFSYQDKEVGNVGNALKLIDYDINNFNFINGNFSDDTEKQQFIDFIKNKPLNQSLLTVKELMTCFDELEAVNLIIKNAFFRSGYGRGIQQEQITNKSLVRVQGLI